MKTLYNITSTALVLLYIVGVLFGVYYFTNDTAKIQQIARIFPEFVYLVVALALLALLAFLFLFLRKEGSMEIVYAASHNTQQSENGTGNAQKNEEVSEQAGFAKHIFFKTKQESASLNVPFLELVLRATCNHLEAGIGVMYVRRGTAMELNTAYGLYRTEGEIVQYQMGEGLVGQVAKDGRIIKLSQVPEGYMEVVSGLGSAYPHYLILYPVKNMAQDVNAVIELATFKNFGQQELAFLEEMASLLAREIEAIVGK